LPRLVRFGAYRGAKLSFLRQVERAAVTERKRQQSEALRDAIIGVVKQSEQLTFVLLAALFMHRQAYSLGAFVALGAYKDCLSQGIRAVFSAWQHWKILEPGRREASDLLAVQGDGKAEESSPVTGGAVRCIGLGCRYAELDALVFEGLDFEV